jgi:hypothetical protein
MIPHSRTKVVCTIGPASSDPAVLRALAGGRAELLVVCGALREGLLEDRRVRRHPGEGVTLDAPGELAAADEGAVDVVEPEGLSGVMEGVERRRGHRRGSRVRRAAHARAAESGAPRGI